MNRWSSKLPEIGIVVAVCFCVYVLSFAPKGRNVENEARERQQQQRADEQAIRDQATEFFAKTDPRLIPYLRKTADKVGLSENRRWHFEKVLHEQNAVQQTYRLVTFIRVQLDENMRPFDDAKRQQALAPYQNFLEIDRVLGKLVSVSPGRDADAREENLRLQAELLALMKKEGIE